MSKVAMAVTKTADNAISFPRFMSLSFRDLPVQIPTSVALDWVSGRDSPATNPLQRSKPPRGVYYLSEHNWSTEMIDPGA
jgi:hypothetical protein